MGELHLLPLEPLSPAQHPNDVKDVVEVLLIGISVYNHRIYFIFDELSYDQNR